MTTQRAKPIKVTVGNVTVKIYSRLTKGGAYQVWEVADYSTGTRRLRSFSDKGEARREAERIARLMASGETTAAQMRGTDAASYGRAVELLRPTGLSLEVAAAIVADSFKRFGANIIPQALECFAKHRTDNLINITVSDAVAEYVADKESKGKSKRHVGDIRNRLEKFAEAFKVNAADVSTAMLQTWLDKLGVAEQTRKNYRTVLHGFFRFCERRGYVAKGGNPVADTEQPKVKSGEVTIYTADEARALLETATAQFLPVLAIQLFAGLRTAEAMRLDWQAIDLAGGHITISAENAKTASRRIVPVLPALTAWLSNVKKESGPLWRGTADELYDAQGECAAAAGVQWKANAARHSFISYRLADIQNAAQVALEAGNSAAVIFKHYRELVKPGAAKTYFATLPDAPANVVAITQKTGMAM